jgi:hypothetical protein
MTDSSLENIPFDSPLQAVKLSSQDTIQFRCHKDIARFNECCGCIDILLTLVIRLVHFSVKRAAVFLKIDQQFFDIMHSA